MADVIFSQRALDAVADHFEYLDQRQQRAAKEFLIEIERTAQLLGEFPALGRKIETLPLRFHITRHFRHRVIYSLSGDLLEIRDVLHPSRDWLP